MKLHWRIIVTAIVAEIAVLGLSILASILVPGLASALSGAANLALAALTVLIIIYNAAVVTATREQAQATKEQSVIAAQSLRLLELNQELDWRPYLVSMEGGGRVTDDRLTRDMTISNIGRGPAINTLYLRQEEGTDGLIFLRTGPLNIGQGQYIEVPAEQMNEDHQDLFGGLAEFPKGFIVCHDQFGNYLRFLPGGAGVTVWREEHDERGALIAGAPEPPWVTAMQRILWGGKPQPQRDPDPGYAFTRIISISGNPTYCESTVALEAVPPSDRKPNDEMADVVEPWMLSLEPQAKRQALDLMWWILQKQGQIGPDFYGRLEAGPMVAVTQVLPVQPRAPAAGGQPETDLQLHGLVNHWKRVITEGLSIMARLRVRSVRLGLTVFTRGNYEQPRMVDVDFTDLPKPASRLTPTGPIPNLLYKSRPFNVETFPGQDVEESVRQLLRLFGYREVDQVIGALKVIEEMS